jgi:hypothetical protein
MWAGLLASACTADGKDEGNLLFMNLLSVLSTGQARLLNHLCASSKKLRSHIGFVDAGWQQVPLATLQAISGIEDAQRLDREIDHLRALGLVDGGFPLDTLLVPGGRLVVTGGAKPEAIVAPLKPTGLALHMFVRCQGSAKSPPQFFDLEPEEGSV